LNVSDGKAEKEVVIRKADIEVMGQTSGEWVLVGRYHIAAGAKAYVTITNKGADGVVVADGVLWVPVAEKK